MADFAWRNTDRLTWTTITDDLWTRLRILNGRGHRPGRGRDSAASSAQKKGRCGTNGTRKVSTSPHVVLCAALGRPMEQAQPGCIIGARYRLCLLLG